MLEYLKKGGEITKIPVYRIPLTFYSFFFAFAQPIGDDNFYYRVRMKKKKASIERLGCLNEASMLQQMNCERGNKWKQRAINSPYSLACWNRILKSIGIAFAITSDYIQSIPTISSILVKVNSGFKKKPVRLCIMGLSLQVQFS